MAKDKLNRTLGIFLTLVFLLSFYTASAAPLQYSVQSWDDSSAPAGESKAPVPLDLWQVSPVIIIAVMLTLFSPALAVPAEIILAGLGLMTFNFRRVEEKTVLDNELRGSIYHYIIKNPGVCFTEIEKGLLVNRGTLEYHLGILKREHRIAVLTKKRRGFYFENSGRYSSDEMEMFAVLRNDTELAICGYLLDYPGASRNEIVLFIKTTCSTASWHLKRLCDSGAVFSTKNGRVVNYHLSGAAELIIGDASES